MSSYYEKLLAAGEVKCIDEEIPFEIPKGWEWCRLNEVATSVTDFVASGSFASLRENVKYYSTKEYALLVRTKDLSCNFSKDLVYTDKHGYDFLSNSNLFGGELILPNIGASIGKVFIVPNLNMPMTLAPNSVMIRLDDVCTKSWLYNVFSSPFGYDTLWSISSSTAQGKFNKTDFRKVLVPIPPIEEQNRIVTKIKELSPYMEKYSKAQEHLDAWNVAIKEILQKSILQEAIQGKLVPQIAEEGTAQELLEHVKAEKQKLVKEGKLKKSALATSVIYRGDDNKYYEQIGENRNDITDEIPFDLPYNWCWCRFSNIVSMTIGKTPARGEQTYWINGEYNWVSISDMVDGGSISTTKEKVSDLAVKEVFSAPISEKGSLLMSFKLSIGKTSILDIEAYHNEAIITIRPVIDKEYAMRNYLFKVLPLIANLGESKDAIKGKTLNSKSLSNLLIPLPPLQEQQRIIEQMNRLSKQLR